MNKNISVWRGSKTPPTNYHLWIKPDNTIYLYDGVAWNTVQNLTKIDTIAYLPSDKNFKDNEFLTYILENDIDITNPEKYNRNQNFTAKKGDFYLSGVMVNTNPEPQVEKDPRVIPSNGSRINIVFKNGDYELGVTSNDEVRTVRRLMEPTWEILGLASNCYIKHIKTGKYLYYDSSSKNYILNEASAYTFKITSKNSSIKSYEIGRSGQTTKLNMKSGSGFNYYISEYDAGDINNEVFFIDPSIYLFPNANTIDQEYQYNILLKSNLNFYIGASSTNSKVLVSNTPLLFYLEKLSDGYYIKNSENKLLNVVSDVFYCDTNYSKFKIAPVGYESNQAFEIVPVNNEAKALNPFRGISDGNELHLWNRGDSNNLVKFVLIRSKHLINRIISTSTATNQHDGLMSASDKLKLDSLSSVATTGLYDDLIDKPLEVTTSKAGLMSSDDKIKLNNLSWSILNDPLNGYEYVDLGLPSGTLWATKNIGAETETDSGLFYAWGDTVGYTSEEIRTNKKFGTGDLYIFGKTDYNKYNNSDQKTVLDLEDDAAYVNMGTAWRMPTIEQIKELENNTTRIFEDGRVILTSNINNKTLHFPLFVALANMPGSVQYLYLGSTSYASFWSNERISIDKAQTMTFSKLFKNTYSEDLLFNLHRFASNNIRGVINLNN